MSTLAERITEALLEAREKDPTVTKSGLARFCGVRPSTVTDWVNGKSESIRGEAANKAAEYLSVSTRWLISGKGEKHSSAVIAFDSVEEVADNEDLVTIPEFSATCGAGPGHEVYFDEVADSAPAVYRRSWFQARGINPNNCKRFKVHGTSMEPFLWDGDTILVDCTPRDILAGKIYAFMLYGEMRVKILIPLIRGGIIIRSVNDSFPDETLHDEDLDTFVLIGRVRDRSGGGML